MPVAQSTSEALHEDQVFTHPESHDRFLSLAASAAAIVIAAISLYAAFYPTGLNWGFHHLAFLPDVIKILFPLLMILLAFPSVQVRVCNQVTRWANGFNTKGRGKQLVLILMLCAVMSFLFWIGRERTFLLGDGTMIVRTIRQIATVADIPKLFRYEPLAGFLLWKFGSLCASWGIASSEEFPVQMFNTLCGVGSILFLVCFVREAMDEGIDRLLLFGFIAVAGSAQLFFGYVEDYPPLYCVLMMYLWLGYASLRRNVHPAIPSAVFGVLFTLHFGMIVMVPSLVYLWYNVFRVRGWVPAILSVCATIVVVMSLLVFVCGYGPDVLFPVIFGSKTHLLNPGAPAGDSQAYTSFSLAHLLDLVNLEVLLVPFAAVSFAALVAFRRTKVFVKDSTFLFLLCTAAGGIAFATIFNFDLGMSRDWDLLASFHLGLCIAAGYAWLQFITWRTLARRLFLMMIGVTFLHTASWVLVNANEERSVARFATLPDPLLWGRRPILAASEELAIYYRGKKDPDHAIEWYKKFLAIDSTNPRIWSSMGYIYHLVGDKENEIRYDEKSIQLGGSFWDTYMNLGLLYFERGRNQESMQFLQKALDLNPSSPEAAYYLGVSYIKMKQDYRTGSAFFLQSLENDPNNLEAIFAAGFCFKQLGEMPGMNRYFTRYLELDPSSQRAGVVRQFLSASR